MVLSDESDKDLDLYPVKRNEEVARSTAN